MTFPMTSLVSEPDPDITASIVGAPPATELGLSEADWLDASTALDKALDPQANGAAVRWSNPDTGASGAFAAAGPAFVRHDRVCRLFKASKGEGRQPASHLGTACRVGAGTWVLEKVKPVPEVG